LFWGKKKKMKKKKKKKIVAGNRGDSRPIVSRSSLVYGKDIQQADLLLLLPLLLDATK
jgi:hypothetical protein